MELVYTIQRSRKRRKLTITIERDRSVIVKAPIGASDEKILEVVEAKRQWIYEKIGHPQKYQDLAHPPGKELVSGESALYLGRQYRIEIVETGLDEIRFAQRFYIPALAVDEMAVALRGWYVGKAKENILPRVQRHARELGVNVGKVRIVDSRYRWGSCTPNDNVSFNWRLIKAPMFVIDYVIVHELAHLIESNHTPNFWNVVECQVPNSEKGRGWLKEHGQILEQIL